MPVAPPPEVAAAQSARYDWTACGAIPAAPPAADSVFANDGSILSIDQSGTLRRFAPDAPLGAALVKAKTKPGGVRLSLVPDGTRLVASGYDGASVFESPGGAVIGLASASLTERATIDLGAAGCAGPVTASWDGSRLVAQGTEHACIFNADDGSLLATHPFGTQLSTPQETHWSSVVGPTEEGTGLLAFREGFLATYSGVDGALSASPTRLVDLRSLAGDIGYASVEAQLSADSTTLVLLVHAQPDRRLIAVDTATGSERWRQSIAAELGYLSVSSSGYALVSNDAIYRLEDGTRVQAAPPGLRGHFEVTDSGQELLQTTRVVRVWDASENHISRIYGGASDVASLDMTPDGRFLAAGGFPSLVWRVADDFSQSKTLLDAAAEGASQVALSPDGDTLLLSGDVVTLARRDGSLTALAQTAESAAVAVDCIHNAWDFAPNGCSAAGFRYTHHLRVHDAYGVETAQRSLPGCADVAFSPDGTRLMTAQLELFDTRTWSLVWSKRGNGPALDVDASAALAYSPDGLNVAITRCTSDCQTSIYDAETGDLRATLPITTSRTTRYSPEGHWLVSGSTLLHLPSGETRSLEAKSEGPAIFTPQGDIIALATDGSLVRFCRSGD